MGSEHRTPIHQMIFGDDQHPKWLLQEPIKERGLWTLGSASVPSDPSLWRCGKFWRSPRTISFPSTPRRSELAFHVRSQIHLLLEWTVGNLKPSSSFVKRRKDPSTRNSLRWILEGLKLARKLNPESWILIPVLKSHHVKSNYSRATGSEATENKAKSCIVPICQIGECCVLPGPRDQVTLAQRAWGDGSRPLVPRLHCSKRWSMGLDIRL